MVKYKFPGKPSKLVQRTLVSAFSVAVPSCDTSNIIENVCCGISVFEKVFGVEDDALDFVGFSDEDVKLSLLKKEKLVHDVTAKCSARGLTYSCSTNAEQISITHRIAQEKKEKSEITLIIAVEPDISAFPNETKKELRKCGKIWFVTKKMVNQYNPKISLRHSFKKNRLLRFKHKSLSSNYLSDRFRRKFIVPSRSLHSSRVIKPTKRLIENEKCVKKARKKLNKSEEDGKFDVHDITVHDDRSKLDVPSSKVIIREARLNITTETAITGPFSMKNIPRANSNNNGSVRKENTRKDNSLDMGNIILRGPRIKHVCRSASSVLRTCSEGDIDDSVSGSSLPDLNKSVHKTTNLDPRGEKGSQLNRIRQCSDSNFSLADGQNDDESSQYHRARSLQDFSKESPDDLEERDREDKLISTDFWEAYDPDEVCKTGFPVISSERLNVRALCFLCGSAGIEKFLYCVACCEPYHWYCAEGPSAFREEAELERYRVNWICRKCKVCSVCDTGGDLRTLSSCKRCRNSYHFECLNNKTSNKRLFKSDRPWICPSCLKCKSCNCSTVFTHVGNIPLCSRCFKLRQKGNYCPLCQGCYQDEDYNVQMMECGICKCWIHAKCEGISSEKYQILSFLPDSVEFVCKLCCTVPPAHWWLAVEDELKAGFYGVLKSLCNNKKIGDMLKESPHKDYNTCSCEKFNNETPSPVAIDIEEKSKSSLAQCKRALNFNLKNETVILADRTSSTKLLDDESARKCLSCYGNVKIRNGISERLLAIKANVRTNQYASVFAFNQQLENVLAELEESDSMTKYREILKQFFPWFNPENVQHEEEQNNSIKTVAKENTSILNRNEDSSDQDDEYLELRKLISADEYNYENFKMLDVRRCKFCQGLGEAIATEGGRLIYCGRNEWVHSNCALWSSEVFEEIDGSLQNVHSAISRGRQISCSSCSRKGASVGCCFKNCTLTYHFLCAQKSKCIFLQNKTIYCNNHDLKDNNLQLLINGKDFEILRPVYIEMDRKKKKMEYHANVRLRIGSLHVESLGKIDPHLSDNPRYIFPMYFRCTRLFWSTKKPWKIIQYHIQIKLKYLSADQSATDVNYTVDHSVGDAQNSRSSSSFLSPSLIEKPLPDDKNVGSSSPPHAALALKNKTKRKIDSENMSAVRFVKSKVRGNGYLSAARLNHVVVQLPQLDGMVDVYAEEEPEPVTCVQCHRTYRTASSYERHLDTCSTDFGDFMISSCESDSVSSEEDKLSGCGVAAKTASLGSSPIIDMNPMNPNLASKYAESYFIENGEKVATAVPAYANNVTANVDVNSILYPCTPMSYEDAHLVNNMLPVTLVQNVKQDTVEVVTPQPINLPVASADPTIKFTFIDNSGKISGCNANYNAHLATPQSYSIQNMSATPTTYVIQQPYQKPTEIIPTFVAVDNTPPLQQIQLQPLAQPSVNFQSMVPTILGAVMQPNIIETTPTTYIVNASTPADLYATQNVLLPSQPVIFGMETVVSNTVMSSSHQFMTQSLTGANIGSSTLYSTTTTQVFQAAKQLASQSASQPDLSSGYIVLNTPVSSESQPSIQAIQTVPALREIQQHAEPRVTVVSDGPINKYMYVQVNNDAKRIAPPVAPKKLPPVILKPAVKPPPLAKKNTKVMKLKNNRPIAIQTAGNVIPLAVSRRETHDILDEDEGTLCPNRKNLQITTTNKTVLCGLSGNDAKTMKTTVIHSVNSDIKSEQNLPNKSASVTVPNNKKVSSSFSLPDSTSKETNAVEGVPSLVAFIASECANTPVVLPTRPVNPSDAILNEKLTTGLSDPLVFPTDGLETTEVENHCESLSKRITKERTSATHFEKKVSHPVLSTLNMPLISTDLRKEKTSAVLNGCKVATVTKVPNKQNASPTTLPLSSNLSKESLPSIVLNERNIADLSNVAVNLNKTVSDTEQKENSAPSMPLLDQLEAERVQDKKNAIDNSAIGGTLFTEPVRRKYVPKIVSQNLDIVAPKNITTLESTVRSTTSETDRIFDELVRQHKLSLEKKKVVAKDKPLTPKVTVPHLQSRDESTNRRTHVPTKLMPVPMETTEESRSSPNSKEKEHQTLGEKNAESKNWKTASISYEVNAEDGFSYKTNDLHDLWNKILESVQHSRNEYNLPLLPKNALVNAESVYGLLGFENKASKFLLEQLPDAWKCIFYKPVFHKSPLYGKTSPVENVSGCARTEPFTSSHKFDMFGWLASRHRKPPKFMIVSDSDIVNGNRRITSLNLPMAMRFRHLKETAKETVGVFRSDIHGRGLFCLRDIDAGEMVIEYAGEVIRSTLTDKREKYYTSKGIGCYMFRIDDRYVVDATMCGNAARFINHSCDPNCYSRIVDILGKKHILIFALRRISKGEELTYDYKFPLEEDKIHCHCLARKCRKYLN